MTLPVLLRVSLPLSHIQRLFPGLGQTLWLEQGLGSNDISFRS
jgi:hypothetical protein